MSGKRIIITAGAPATDVDVQRLADVASSSEDRVWDMTFTPGWVSSTDWDKKVFPLVPEPGLQPYVHPRMVYPGTTTGGADVLPAFYVVGNKGDPSADANTSNLSASKQTLYSFPATSFPSSVTNGRTDLVYAKVEAVNTSQTRKFKSPTTGQVTIQNVLLYSAPTVTFGVAQGAADGSFTAPFAPSDTTSAWYFPLATVLLDDGGGGAWTEGTTIGQDRITQVWEAGWLRRHRVQLAEPADIMQSTYVGGSNGRANTPLSNRWGATISVAMVLQHKTDGTGSYVFLDTAHDWSRRLLRVTFTSIVSDITGSNLVATTPDSISVPPLSILTAIPNFLGVCFTPAVPLPGYLSGQQQVLAIPLDAAKLFNLFVDDSGYLKGEFKGVPYDYNSTTPVYLMIVEASDQFLL